jgi:hypothetical protein
MNKEQHIQEIDQSNSSQRETKSLLEKRLIWQHLAQKKIKKALRSKLWSKQKQD